MANEEKGTFGLFGSAWEVAKIYSNSNEIKKYDAIAETQSYKTLGNFVRSEELKALGVQLDTANDDRLDKYGVVKITPTRNLKEVENPLEMYLITDDKGHDIGIFEMTEHGPQFRLAKKIADHNQEIIDKFSNEKDKDILEEEYSVNTLEKLTQKLSKGEELLIRDKRQAVNTVKEQYIKKGAQFEEEEKELSPEEEKEQEEENRAINSVPEDMRDALFKLKQSGAKIKGVLIINNPSQLADRIDNNEGQVSRDGGPVILVKVSHTGADSIQDDYIPLQDGKELKNFGHSEHNDPIFENIMKHHEGVGTIDDLDNDDRNSAPTQEELAEAEALTKEKEKDLARAKEILLIAQEKIDEKKKKIEDLESQKGNLNSEEYEIEEGTLESIEEQKKLLEEDIEDIKQDAEKQLDGLRGRLDSEQVHDLSKTDKATEDVDGKTNKEPEEQEEDQVKDRWKSSDPYNGGNGGY